MITTDIQARRTAADAGSLGEEVDLSILVVSWNTRDMLARCLASVDADLPASAKAGAALEVETVVVDNGSSDGSLEMVAHRFPHVRVLANGQNLGFARANNQAIEMSRGRYLLLLNSDTVVHPGALHTLVQYMEDRPAAGGCGARLLNADGSLQVSCHPLLTPGREFWRLLFLDRVWRRARYDQQNWDPARPRRVEVIKGACFLLRRLALEQVGLLDEQYFMYTEEMDLCYRLLRAGWQLWWVPQAVVTHYGGASSSQAAEAMYLELYRSKVQFHQKFGGPRQAARFKRLMQLAYVPRWAVATLIGAASPSHAARARTYRRLLAELPGMH
jgi:GT2 family glycosyltransferase